MSERREVDKELLLPLLWYLSETQSLLFVCKNVWYARICVRKNEKRAFGRWDRCCGFGCLWEMDGMERKG